MSMVGFRFFQESKGLFSGLFEDLFEGYLLLNRQSFTILIFRGEVYHLSFPTSQFETDLSIFCPEGKDFSVSPISLLLMPP